MMMKSRSSNSLKVTNFSWWIWVLLGLVVIGVAVTIIITAITLSNQNEIKDHLKDIAYAMKAFRDRFFDHRKTNSSSSSSLMSNEQCIGYCKIGCSCNKQRKSMQSTCNNLCSNLCTSLCSTLLNASTMQL